MPGQQSTTSAIVSDQPPGRNFKAKNRAANDSIKHFRRYHSKSRNGCLACKFRKVKCDEKKPSCKSCEERDIGCAYPEKLQAISDAPTDKAISITYEPTAEPLFGPQEIQYFHHFLIDISHPLPLGNDNVWLHEIPQLSHQYQFLLHAILALGGSDLARSKSGFNPSGIDVLKHRGQAISGVQTALKDSSLWSNDGHVDSILATLYILVSQSAQMKDGARDFETFSRGCALITSTVADRGIKTALTLDTKWAEDRLSSALYCLIPQILSESDKTYLQTGITYLEGLEPLTIHSPCHRFFRTQIEMCRAFCYSPQSAFLAAIQNYSFWYTAIPRILAAVKAEQDSIGLVVVAAFLAHMALCKVITPLRLWAEKPIATPELPWATLQGAAQWVEAIHEIAPESDEGRLTWPRIVMGMIPGSANVRKDTAAYRDKVEVLQMIDQRAHMLVGDILKVGSELVMWVEKALEDKYNVYK